MKRITVRVFGGTTADKIVVEDKGDVLVVTTEEEWLAFQAENRVPVVVGFKREYVVEEYQDSD